MVQSILDGFNMRTSIEARRKFGAGYAGGQISLTVVFETKILRCFPSIYDVDCDLWAGFDECMYRKLVSISVFVKSLDSSAPSVLF
jgi:hypothetical protein